MAGLLDWLLGPAQGPGTPQVPPQPQHGGILTRMGDALIGMNDPYGMMDKGSLTPEARQQMIGQTLLNLGTGIASSNARNPLAAAGQGMQYAQYQGQQQGDNRLRGLMYRSQLGKLEGENRTKEYLRSRPKPAGFGGTDDDWRLFVDSNPGEAFKLVSERPDPNKLITYGPDGQPTVNQAYLEAQKAIRAAGRSVTNVNNIGSDGVTYGAPPPGMAWARGADGKIALTERPGPDGQMVRVPMVVPLAGGKEERERVAEGDKAKQQSELTTRYGNVVIQDIGRALTLIDNNDFTTGVVGAITKSIPGTPGHDLNNLLDGIKSNIGFDRLQQMRQSSPTGGALGAVSERENILLQAAYGALVQSGTQKQLRENLLRVQNIYMDIVHGTPEQIRQAVQSGAIDQATAEQLSKRHKLPFDRTGGQSGGRSRQQILEQYGVK